ncbi:MAG: exodeoxyribonuclease VII large subunit, partial [Kangiellaceae bacterium]|nr:exodeoxyribonuclease VII large subunit [Kangiellaceae bacterium]
MLKPILQPQKPTNSGHKQANYLTVSQLNAQVKTTLERGIGQVLLQGEISNFIAAGSGHWYFSLKDSQAQVKCTMWRGKNQRVRFNPEDGLKVYVRAKVTLYEPRGDYQLAIDFMEPAGVGDLQLQFEQLKKKLQQQGLFDTENKQAIPDAPNKVGVITSASGAALHDVLTVMKRRFPLTEVIIYPTQVQGAQAHNQICQAINLANKRQEVDVLLLTRGGGSLEDLWCFNHESVANAIFQSQLPLVSAIGHEVDFTIADFVADQRAATPSAAAELVTPDQHQVVQKLDELSFALIKKIQSLVKDKSHRLALLSHKQTNPDVLVSSYQTRLKQLLSELLIKTNRVIDVA